MTAAETACGEPPSLDSLTNKELDDIGALRGIDMSQYRTKAEKVAAIVGAELAAEPDGTVEAEGAGQVAAQTFGRSAKAGE